MPKIQYLHKTRQGIPDIYAQMFGDILQNMNFSRYYRNRGKFIYAFDPNIIINAKNKVFFPESYVSKTWEEICESADTMRFEASNKEKSMVKVPVSLGLDLLVDASVGVGLAGSSETSYVTQTGYTEGDSLYVTAEMENTDTDINNAKMSISDIFTSPIKAIGEKISDYLVDTAGKVVDGVKNAGAWVKEKYNKGKDWIVHIVCVKKEGKVKASAVSESFAIDTYLYGSSGIGETPGSSMTVGNPYMVYVTDAGENEVADFTDNPLVLKLDYDDAALMEAGVSADDVSALGVYMYSEEKCGYIYLGGQVDIENQQVAVDITKPGQYILAVDNLPPSVYDIYVSDTSSTPTITAFFSEISGFSKFSMKIDDAEYVNETSLDRYFNHSSGSFAYKVEEPLTAGEHKLSFYATDGRGNATVQPITFTFMVDCTDSTHKWNSGKVVVEATCKTVGKIQYECDICGQTKMEDTAFSGHQWGDWVKISSATALQPEKQQRKCRVCNKTETKSVGVKLDVAKKGDTFTLNGYNYIITKVASTVSFTGIKGSKTTLTIPATVKYDGKTYKVTEVSSAALKNNKNVKTIKLGSNIKTISSYAFSFCAKLEKVTIGSGVKTIGKGAFNGCKKLKSVAIGKNVTKIEASAFYKCKALTKTTIPGKVTSIGNAAFDGCSKLKTITIKSDKLKKIGKNAFVRIKKGASIKVPKSKYTPVYNFYK